MEIQLLSAEMVGEGSDAKKRVLPFRFRGMIFAIDRQGTTGCVNRNTTVSEVV